MSVQTNQPIVMVMDDDEDVRFIAGILLNKLGFAIEFASSGEEAIEKCQKSFSAGVRYKAAILDLNVPGGMGGREALPRLIQIDPDIVAYVSCGNPYDAVVENPEAFGFKGAINKPFLPEQLKVLLGK
ncbi:response regulator [Geobacter argillaceus]|nr:response regulator [Geobacter argillaceus]